MKNILVFFAGFLFSVGLFVSGMTNPQKVISFLDVGGNWNSSLLFVMGAAVIVTTIFYRLAWARPKPIFESDFDLPIKQALNSKLLIGSILFGVGWGLSGVCPGPSVANIFAGNMEFLVFVLSMLTGMLLKK